MTKDLKARELQRGEKGLDSRLNLDLNKDYLAQVTQALLNLSRGGVGSGWVGVGLEGEGGLEGQGG